MNRYRRYGLTVVGAGIILAAIWWLVTLAKIFLFVVDVGFLDQISAPLVIDVESRLEKLGRFQLKMAQERATAQQVEAQAILRQGQLHQELVKVAREIEATLIVFGRPIKPTAFFEEAALQKYIADLQAETDIEVRILGGQQPL